MPDTTSIPEGDPTPAPAVEPVAEHPATPRYTLPPRPKSTFLFVILILAGMFAAAWFGQRGINWFLVAITMAVLLAVLGWHITGRPGGIFINERNLMSLSRFQMAIWTVIILSGFFTMAISRIKAGSDDPLAIALDWHLWALMGISTASLIGSPLVLSGKKDQQPDPGAVTKAAETLKENRTEIDRNREGVLYSNPDITCASFIDMFQGDEVQNTTHLDLAKVQMFLFTLIAATAYSVTLCTMFNLASNAPGGLEAMPGLSEGLIAILGISHAGFLASKGVAHTKTK